MPKTLIKNGYVLSMDQQIGDQSNCDILIEGDRIIQIGSDLPQEGCIVVDASNCIVLPGFVDTHRHTWQTQLRTVAANWTLFDYLVYIRMAYSAFYTKEDAYLGNYAGALESINAGITTLVDHSHLINSPEHADRLIDGLGDAGVRSVFCYGFFVNPTYNPFRVEEGPGWRYEDIKRIRKERLYDDSALIRFGVNPSEYDNTPTETVIKELALCRDLGANVISAHVGMGAYDAGLKNVLNLANSKLIKKDMLFVHGSALTQEELECIKAADAGISSTPEVEMQMGMGYPMGLRGKKQGLRTSIGLDIVSNYASEMFTQMRTLLASQRAIDNENTGRDLHKIPGKLYSTAKDALYLATMGGAEAIHMENEIGSLTPGKKADLLLIRRDDINMPPTGDAYASVVFYANTGNIDTVMIDGVLKKQHGKLLGIDGRKLSDRLYDSSTRIVESVSQIDHKQNEAFWCSIFGGHVHKE